ncbi:hypothetical protein F8388_012825 [Cannabis sativa]|uniref:Reverse transcriptase zinc-binding domain-containing protein n=1 Tax=Cannabis sativa TaxID=3483 RepID=A0A7J6F6U8_CANSA|nr:hypothetical protein F8388_012825 [Cannabis sativa]
MAQSNPLECRISKFPANSELTAHGSSWPLTAWVVVSGERKTRGRRKPGFRLCSEQGLVWPMINYTKSLLLFSSNTPEGIRVQYVSSLAMTMTEEILGLPMVVGRNKKAIFRPIKGLRRRIGNGANTRVFKDPWIPRPPSFLPITKEVGNLMMVSKLIEQPGQWNKDLIHQVFSTPDSQLILSIPITLFEHDDDWLWHFTSHGHYSVKSGYNMPIGGENLQPSSSNEVMAAWWSSYWAIQIPKKILHFGWKGFHEILPSFSGLLRRQSSPHSNCPICGFRNDTNAHAIFWCSFSQERNKTKKGVSAGCTSEQSNAETEVLSYELYVDAAISTPQNVIGFGAVIFSSDKQMKAALSKPLQERTGIIRTILK